MRAMPRSGLIFRFRNVVYPAFKVVVEVHHEGKVAGFGGVAHLTLVEVSLELVAPLVAVEAE